MATARSPPRRVPSEEVRRDSSLPVRVNGVSRRSQRPRVPGASQEGTGALPEAERSRPRVGFSVRPRVRLLLGHRGGDESASAAGNCVAVRMNGVIEGLLHAQGPRYLCAVARL